MEIMTIITPLGIVVTLFCVTPDVEDKEFQIRVALEGGCVHYVVYTIYAEKPPVHETMRVAESVTLFEDHIYVGSRWIDKPRPQNLYKKPRKRQ